MISRRCSGRGLYRAGRQLADMFFADLRRLARREVTFAETDMADS